MTQDVSVLDENRRKLADMVTQTVRQTAQVIEEEQKELQRRFPAMAHQPAPVMLDPSVIRDFTESQEYKQAIEAYIAGRLEVNLLVRILELLEMVAPVEFFRR
jgi:predicted P-loop ATPase/GTPase